MKKFGLLILVFLLLITNVYIIYNGLLKSVSDKEDNVEFIVEKGENYISLASKLKEKNLIRSELAYKVYLKLNEVKPLQAGKYNLSESMSVNDILVTLGKGSNYNNETIKITFKEGKNMRSVASIIVENTNNTEADIYNLLKDNEYLDNLISEYWFLTDDIKKENIYYSLEGYLFPDTYEFLNKDVSVKTIFKTMLDNMLLKIEPFKNDIQSSNYSVHDLITLASIVELEGASNSDRKGVAGVFYNRLKDNWFLGSDVTTYYAEKKDDWNGLSWDQLNACNGYNTRGTCFSGLPVGPICNPGLNSLSAVFEPEQHDNYYFVADCKGKTYLTKNESEHNKIVQKLKSEGIWCES